MKEIEVELLLGRKVLDVNGEKVGRIEEIRCERRDKDCLVEAFLVGSSGLFQRLNAWSLIRPVRYLFRGSKVYTQYVIPWDKLDLTDPERPTTRLPRTELSRARL
jgi:sporulation protein YlmC with PRC-barrel domain